MKNYLNEFDWFLYCISMAKSCSKKCKQRKGIYGDALPTNLDILFIQSADSMYDLSDTVSVGSPGFGSPILGGSTQSLTGHTGAPELLVSLSYASLTGRLTVEVLKASNLRYLQLQRAPGMYFFLLLKPQRNL